MARKPGKKSPAKLPNVAARALREGQFQPKVVPDPKAYKRRPKHPKPLPQQEAGENGD